MDSLGKIFSRLWVAIALICSAIGTSAYAEPLFEPREDGSLIRYYVETPQEASFPIVLVLQGSQCETINQFLSYGSLVIAKGLGLLAIEKYGLSPEMSACPDEFLKNNTIDQRLNDTLRVLSAIRSSVPHWDGRLFLLGAGDGALLAARLSAVVFPKKIVLISAGLGMTLADSMPLAVEKQMKKQGSSEGLIRAELAKFPVKYNEILSNPTWRLTWMGNSNTYKYWNSILFHHPWEDILNYAGPVLDIHGAEDAESPLEASRKLKQIMEQNNRVNLTRWELAGFDHYMIDQSGESHLMDVMSTAIDWIKQ